MKTSVKIAAGAASLMVLLGTTAVCSAEEAARPHVDAVIAREKQKAQEARENEGKLSLKAITALIREEQNRSRGVLSANMFENPDKDNVMEAFRQFLLQQPINHQGGAELAPGEAANRDEIVQLYGLMKCIQDTLHPAMRRVLKMASVGEFAKRLRKLDLIRDYVDEYFAEQFRAFDEAFDQFKKDTIAMQENAVTNVTGTELLMSSKLDQFATNGMKTQPRFDKVLRALDNHLAASDNTFLSKLREDTDALYKLHEECMKAYMQTRDTIAGSKYADRVAGIMDNYADLIAQVEKLCLRIDKLIQEAEREDTIWGKVRHASASLAPHGALQAGASASGTEKGTPFYSRRVRLAILECQAFYEDTVKRMNAANRNTPGYSPIPAGWR